VNSRRVIVPEGLPEPPAWSNGVAAGDWVFGSAAMATDWRSGLLPAARPQNAERWLREPLELESELILDAVEAVVTAAGGDVRHDLIRLWQWIAADYPSDQEYARSRSFWPAHPSGTPYAQAFGRRVGDRLRASTGIGVRQLPVPDALMAVDFMAVAPGTGSRKVEVELPPEIPMPKIGYSPATRYGDWVFLAGFGATDFAGDWMSERHMGEPSMVAPAARVNPYIWLGSEIEAQTRYTLSVLQQIAEAAGSSLSQCVKADVTLTHPSDFPGMDRVWREFFPEDPPARNVTTGAQLVIKGLRVEIALVLLANDATVARRAISVEGVANPPGHAPQAMVAGDLLFTSTLHPIGVDSAVPEDIRVDDTAPRFRESALRQTDLLVGATAAICEAAGSSLDNVCKVQSFLSDLAYLPSMMTGWRSAFPVAPPALSAVAMGGSDPLMVADACLQWDVIAYVPQSGA
jgi:enamine deaminase RidA (YjgF/YER057c/UK114 family)